MENCIMRKKLTIILSVVMVLIIAACQSGIAIHNPTPPSTVDSDKPTTTEASTVASDEPTTATPIDGITKAEFVAQLTDFFEWPEMNDYNDVWENNAVDAGLLDYTITDVELEDQYGRQIKAAYEQGIVTLDASKNFNPDQMLTRGEVAEILASAWKLSGPEALVTLGVMAAGDAAAEITKDEALATFATLQAKVVCPVYVMPRPGYDAPRRYIEFFCATPGATIYFTNDGTAPTTRSFVYAEQYTQDGTGHIMEMLGARGATPNDPIPEERDVTYKAFAIKEGMIQSDVQTYTWHLYRPLVADQDFQTKVISEGTATSPKIVEIWNDSESVRAMAWYIEGPTSGIIFDALQTPPDQRNLKEFIDANVATKPYVCVVGHEHGDHDAQVPAFINGGIEVYINQRGWAPIGTPGGFGAVVTTAEAQALVKNVEKGDKFDLGGGIVLDVYALPGHANGNVILNDKKNGLVFSSDIYGCTRAGSADNVGIGGVQADLLLSLAQQVHTGYLENGGIVNNVFTGHDEFALNENNLDLFEAALQQVVDNGEAGCSPTLRTNDAVNSRTTIIGDMWKDGTNWISLKLSGVMGDDTEYLTHNDQFNYNGADGYKKYSVLSNVVITGGDLEGAMLSWADSATLTWNNEEMTVENALTDMFNPWVYAYTINVAAGTTSIDISPVTMSTKVTSLKLNGQDVAYKSVNRVTVADGTVITIDVTAADGTTKSTYTFTVKVE